MTQKPSGFKEHQVMLCLDKEPYHGFIQIQADRDLGRSYAGLLPFVEGLYHLGYISKEVYDAHFKKYSEPLISARLSQTKQRRIQDTSYPLLLYNSWFYGKAITEP